MNNSQWRRWQVEVGEAEVVEEVGGELVFITSGEFLPGEEAPKQTQALETALVPVRKPTTEEILEAFTRWMRLDVADGNPSPETIRSYLCDVRQHLEWLADEGLLPAQAGEDDLKAYRAWLVEEYAITTVGRKLASVRRFYEMARARGAISHNPAAGLSAPADKTARMEKVKWLPLETVKAVLSAPNKNTPDGLRDRAILMLMAIHGLRTVEVHRLDLENIDLEAGEAGTARVFGKGDKYRTILLTDESREVLKMWLAARSLMRLASQAVFVAMNAAADEPKRLSRRGIREVVDKYLEMVGAKKPGVSCHALRHSCATLALAGGGSLLAISKMLGHSQVTTTQVYADIVDKNKNNPAKFLVGLLD